MTFSILESYPWVTQPMIVSAPMRLISLVPLAVAVSRAGGLGFISASTDLADLESNLAHAKTLLTAVPISSRIADVLPIGIGFINWGADLGMALDAIEKYNPVAVWFFAPKKREDLVIWTSNIREVTQHRTHIWVQVGTVAEAIDVAQMCTPDVLVIQGNDAGGHGLVRGAGIISLLPEVADALRAIDYADIPLFAAGGLADGRGVAACLTLGSHGVVMGTRFLACKEATLAKGYQDEVIRASDGGTSTVRSKVYDVLRGTHGWPDSYNGRGIINQSYIDATASGTITEENKQMYAAAVKYGDRGWGIHGRMTTYAGTGVGLIREVKSAQDILDEIRKECAKIQLGIYHSVSKL